ncbi:MAG: UpxY family transcription antiterminator [Rikenellaceae bacterium]
MDNISLSRSQEIEESESHKWFVMAPIYYQEHKIKSYLDLKKIRCYLPTKLDVKSRNGKKQIVQVPTVSSLLFVYSTESELKKICQEQPYLYYKYDKTDGGSRKMVIQKKQMEDFIRVSNFDHREVVYFDPKQVKLNLKRGVPVRLHCSDPAYDGVEGIYTKVEGKRDKQLVISLNGLYALSMKIEKIDVIEML